MDSDSEDSENPFPPLLRQLFLLLLSLADDALIVGCSRLGCRIPWLEWLSPIVLTATVLYLALQFGYHGVPKLIQMWHEFKREFKILKT